MRRGKDARRGNGESDNALTGEAGLWGAVLLRAEADLVGAARSGKDEHMREVLRKRARAWILSDRDEVGSFVFCCTATNLLPEAVREAFFKNTELCDAA